MIRNSTAEFSIFTSQRREDSIEVMVEDETIWLTQKLIAQLFDVNVPTISILETIANDGKKIKQQIMRKFGNSEFLLRFHAEHGGEIKSVCRECRHTGDFDKMIKEIEKK